jgi:hypothetical protein
MIETEVWSEKEGWNAHVIWGFAVAAIVSKGSHAEHLTFVYDRL